MFIRTRFQNNRADLLWHVKPEEIKFDDGAEVLGQGSFGVVLLAEYRGTEVGRRLRSYGLKKICFKHTVSLDLGRREAGCERHCE